MKKILITGITGFVGTYLAEYLSQDSHVQLFGTTRSLIDREDETVSKITFMHADFGVQSDVYKIIEAVKPDEVYHLAALSSPAESIKKPSETIINNVNAQVFLLEALRSIGLLNTKVLVVCSSDEYGIVDQHHLPVDEDTLLRPANPYAVSKVTQDYLALQYFLSYKMPIVRVRPFPHVGPRQSEHFVLSTFAKQIAMIEKGLQEPTLKHGNLDAKRDFTDVRDMVRAYVLLMEKGEAGEVYNVGSGRSISINEALTMLLGMATVTITLEKDPERMRPSDMPNLFSDNAKMEQITNWKPEIPFEQTLKDILDYWRDHLESN